MAGSIMDSKSSHNQPETSSGGNNNNQACQQASDNVATFRDLLEASTAMAKQHSPQAGASRPSSSSIMHSLASSPNRPTSTGKNSPEPLDHQRHTPEYLAQLTDTGPSTPQCGGVGGPSGGGAAAYSPHSERSSSGSTSANGPQQFCLRWNNYQSNLTSVFDQLLQTEAFVDVTLACDGRSIKAHKMVLSACSPYFQTLFSTTPCQHPIVIMRDVNWRELKSIVDFMYKGEINVSQDQIGPLLRIAEMLKVRGLADVGTIGTASETAQLSAKPETTSDKELYSPPPTTHAAPSPKLRKKSLSPYTKRPQSRCRRSSDNDHPDLDLLTQMQEPEKRPRVESASWDLNLGTSSGRATALELRLSPLQHQHQHAHQHQHLLGRNVRKRRWPSADTVFNPPESPLGSLIAAERAEQERTRERERERERERDRDGSLFTPPMPVISGASSGVLDSSAHIDFPSPSPTPTPNLMPPARTPSGMLTSSSPHLQISHHHHQQQQQQHHQHQHPHSQHQTHPQHHSTGLQSHRSSPASSVTSTHPSSILSRPLTPSPASVGGPGGVGSRLESDRFQLGPAQAAAMLGAAAASQMDLSATGSMGMRSLPSSGQAMAQGPSHHSSSLVEDLEIKPGIAEMIREEERVSATDPFRFLADIKSS